MEENLASDHDWEKQTAACTKIKEYSKTNPEYFSSTDPYITQVIRQLIRTANSLRTQLSRSTLATFAVLFENLGKVLDHQLDQIVPVLVKKAGDKNAFIAEEAEKAIIEMCGKSNEAKVVLNACPLIDQKIISIKVKAIFALNLILE